MSYLVLSAIKTNTVHKCMCHSDVLKGWVTWTSTPRYILFPCMSTSAFSELVHPVPTMSSYRVRNVWGSECKYVLMTCVYAKHVTLSSLLVFLQHFTHSGTFLWLTSHFLIIVVPYRSHLFDQQILNIK